MSTSVTRRKVKSSRDRNDHGRFGWTPSVFSIRHHKRLANDVKGGFIPETALRVSMMIGRQDPKPKARGGVFKKLSTMLRGE